ncbi:hypothetical protein EDB92DRAFT_1819275 [Lactarius akahatsu]|nr:hypothetical protein EDB92DRAFT_1819275 [Lactarius akahatsu]
MPFKLWLLPYASAPALNCLLASSPLTPPTGIIPTQNQFQRMLFGLARKLLRVLLKAVWKGLKGAIESLVARTTAMGWHIRLDMRVHLNIANGSCNMVDQSFELI